jgi:hypothetical protein
MQNDVILEKMDDCIEESRWIRKGNLLLEAFDLTGSLWPLVPGKYYRVDLDLGQLDFDEPVIINKTDGNAEQIDETFAYYLYGYVKNNTFHVGDFKFDFSEYNDYDQFEGKYLKFKSDRIYVELLEELPNQNNC